MQASEKKLTFIFILISTNSIPIECIENKLMNISLSLQSIYFVSTTVVVSLSFNYLESNNVLWIMMSKINQINSLSSIDNVI